MQRGAPQHGRRVPAHLAPLAATSRSIFAFCTSSRGETAMTRDMAVGRFPGEYAAMPFLGEAA